MNPEQKAKELMDKFSPFVHQCKDPIDEPTYAQQCALICATEIQDAIDLDLIEAYNSTREHAYWEQVKQEILKAK